MTSVADPSKVFGSSKDTKVNDKAEFLIANDNKYWIHNVEAPYTLFKFHPSKRLKNKVNIDKRPGMFYKQMAVFEPVTHETIPRGPVGETMADVDPGEDSELASSLSSEDTSNAFIGYFASPKITINEPSLKYKHKESIKPQVDLSRFVYHNQISTDELVYIFGGLYNSEFSSFEDYGLPRNVDPKKISVCLPVDLPPYLDRDILMSPYFVSNRHFHLFSPHRGTVNLLDTLSSNLPFNLCSLESTQISHRHYFLFGGFELIIKSVRYDASIDRWIVEKDIKLNEKGYVFDTKTLKFTSITLNSKPDNEDVSDYDFQIGRLGSSLVGNVYDRTITEDSISSSRAPTPTRFIDSSYFSPYIPSDSASANIKISPSSSPSIKNKSVGFGLQAANKTVINTKNHLNSEPSTPASTSSAHGYFKVHKNSTNSSSTSDSNGKLKKTKSVSSREPKTNKMDKIINRGNAGHTSSPVPRQSSPLLYENNNHKQLLSTYSNQVKKNRSNSNSGSLSSRPVSPIPQQALYEPIPLTGGNFKNLHIPSQDDSQKSNNTEPDVVESKCYCYEDPTTLCNYCLSVGKKVRYANDLFGNTVVRPSDALTSIFIFGGFVESTNERGNKKFIASNDFLRIDLICEGEYLAQNIKKEAIIYKVKFDDNAETPSPRGYFACTLIDHNMDEEECHWTNTRPWSPSSIFDDESSSNHSVSTSNSRHTSRIIKVKLPEKFYESKALLLHGGYNEEKKVFTDMYMFKFGTAEWMNMDTYAYKYFDKQIQPFDDDLNSYYTNDNLVKDPDLIDAELRACHHKALYYNKLGRGYVFFIGGFSNHFLRNSDPEPYYSDKFDVSRLARTKVAVKNSNVSRILVYNIQTQTWGFHKYCFDFRKSISAEVYEKLKLAPAMYSANYYHHGSNISLNGNIITILQGLVSPVAEEKANNGAVEQAFPGTSLVFGGYVQITFPSL